MDQSEGKCGKIVTLNVCVDENDKKTSSQYVLGEDSSSPPLFVGFLAILGAAGFLYHQKDKKNVIMQVFIL